MALDKFKAAPLPNPPTQWDPQYMRQVIRVLELYFSQLDSNAANHASKYTADEFVGGAFTATSIDAGDVNTVTLEAVAGEIGELVTNVTEATYVGTDSLHVHSAEITTLMTDSVYGGTFYGDGRYLQTPYNQFTSSSDQTAASVANAYAITYDTSDFPDGITLSNSSRINVAYQGIYQFIFSIQFENTINGTETVDVWFRKNGTDIADSNSSFSLPPRKSAGVYSYLIAVTPFMVDLQANDYIEIMWRVSDVGVSIQHLPAVTTNPGVTPAIPATPSVILTVQFVSAQFPPVTRVAPLPVFGFGQIGDISVSIR